MESTLEMIVASCKNRVCKQQLSIYLETNETIVISRLVCELMNLGLAKQNLISLLALHPKPPVTESDCQMHTDELGSSQLLNIIDLIYQACYELILAGLAGLLCRTCTVSPPSL